MAITGQRSNEVREYICRDDPSTSKEDGATVFYHQPIPNSIITRITDQQASASMSFGDMSTQTFTQRQGFRNRECFRFGVTGWDNFFDENGEPIVFELEPHMEGGRTFSVVSEACMNLIYNGTIQEVGTDVWNKNNLTDAQRKNFEASSSLLDGSRNSNARTAGKTSDANEDASDQPSETEEAETVDLSDLPPGAAILAAPNTARKSATKPKPKKTTAPSGTGKTQRPARGRTGAPVG